MANADIFSCEELRPLLSAMLDGELTDEEQVAVDGHLASCSDCRHQLEMFENVDRCVQTQVNLSANLRNRVAKQVETRVPKHETGWTRSMLLVAAGLVVAVALPVLRAPPAIQADDVIQPLVALELIEQQEGLTRQSLYRTVELDLRALTLELQEAEVDDKTRDVLTGRIESLISKLQAFESIDSAVDP